VKAFSEDTAKRLENFGFIQSRPGGSVYPITHATFYVLDACKLVFSYRITLFYHAVFFFLERARDMRTISLRRAEKRSIKGSIQGDRKAPITVAKNKETRRHP
jgi:hypothetical protein